MAESARVGNAAAVLVVVRHAEAVKRNVGGVPEDQRPLTDRGQRQALRLVDQLARWNPARVLSSPYRRAIDTVSPTADRLGLVVELRPELREWDDGLATLPDGAWEPLYEACWDDPEHRHGTGESHQEVIDRAGGVLWQQLASDRSGPVVVASHGTWVARGLECLGITDSRALWHNMPTPAVYTVEPTEHGLRINGPGIDAKQ